MTNIQQRPNEYPAELVNAPTPPIIVEQPTVIYHQHWLAAVERLHPATQVAVAVALGFGLPVALGYMATGLATFALALLSQFILAIGAGVGIIVLVVVGVTAISRL